jgi:hypothetical protein
VKLEMFEWVKIREIKVVVFKPIYGVQIQHNYGTKLEAKMMKFLDA